MEAGQFLRDITHIANMVTTLRGSGGTDIVPVRMLAEDVDMQVMTVNVKDIPFVAPTFNDTGMFAHQSIVRCVYRPMPIEHFYIVGNPAAVQHCVTNYILGCTKTATTELATDFRKKTRETPEPHPLKFCDVRNVNKF
jgi:hypothetical protein